MMFERFVPRARRVVVTAGETARNRGHDQISTAHLLLALLRDEENAVGEALAALQISSDEICARIETALGRGHRAPESFIPFTSNSKAVLQNCVVQANRRDHYHVEPEHVLLALVEIEGTARHLLIAAGVQQERLRQLIFQQWGK